MDGPATATKIEDAEYSIVTHRHNFAVWAAARASQRGFTSTRHLKAALEGSGLHLVIRDPARWPTCEEQFDQFHRLYCRKIVDHLTTAGVPKATYGRAAKLLAIYLKCMIVLSEHAESVFATVVHAPIDRNILNNLAKDRNFDPRFRRQWRSTNWTTLSEDEYFALITQFRKNSLHKPAFWVLERYWDLTKDSEGK